jgi:Ni/Co efflux regulator RcnB
MLQDYYRVHRLPPSYAKRYLIGAPLPSYVRYYPVPRDVLVRMRPVPRGYEYVRVDNDVLLISLLTREVLDAVSF